MAVQSEECELAVYIKLTKRGLSEKPQIILWPEYALPYDINAVPEEVETVRQLAAENDAIIILGTKDVFSKEPYQWYNTALVIDSTGIIGRHRKNRPVHFFDDGTPGTEALPVTTTLGAIGTPICFDCDYTDIIMNMTVAGTDFFMIPSFDARHWSEAQHWQHADIFRTRAAENGRWLMVAATSGVSQLIDPHGNVIDKLPPMAEGVLHGTINNGSAC